MSFALGTALIIAGVGLAGSIISNERAKDQAEKMEEDATVEKQRYEREMNAIKENRQELKNPYGNMQNAFANMTNPYAKLTNQYANLGVATQAAEFQAEQADMALANTLDTMAATGMGSGGATALAQAALQSKKGISADIQRQEAQNQQLAAKGAMDVAEKQAMGQMQVDQMKAAGEERVATLKGQGTSEVQQLTEARTNMDLANASGMMMNQMQMENDAQAMQMQASLANGQAMSQFGSSASSLTFQGLS